MTNYQTARETVYLTFRVSLSASSYTLAIMMLFIPCEVFMEPELIAYFTQLLGSFDTQGRQLVQGFLTLASESTHFCDWLGDLYERALLGDGDLVIKFIIDALNKKGLIHDPNLTL